MARPTSEAELSDLVRSANAPLSIRGGHTRGMACLGDIFETTGLHGVRLYEPGALTLVAGAGTPLDEIETILAEKGQRLAFEPMDHRALLGTTGTPTIGGVAAANISGPRRIQTGAARDHMLGIRMVSGTGEIVKNGGRVMKNVTGYDLVKLMAGSFGTLGILTEVSLKVQAIPEAEATIILRGQDMTQAVSDLTRAMGTPFDVSGSGWLSAEATGGQSERRIRIEGMAGSVKYRAARLSDMLGSDAVVEGADSASLWREMRDVTPFAGRDGAVWRISTRPTAAANLCKDLSAHGLATAIIADWSGGLVWLLTPDASVATGTAIRERVAAVGGHATIARGATDQAETAPVFHPSPRAIALIETGLRQKFDPRGILNPGLMGPKS